MMILLKNLKLMNKKHFGFLEMVGSIILLLIDPNRWDNKKYLKPQYLRLNRIIGIITICVLIFACIFSYLKYLS